MLIAKIEEGRAKIAELKGILIQEMNTGIWKEPNEEYLKKLAEKQKWE